MRTLSKIGWGALAAAALMMVAAGCGRSVEGETNRWNNNKLELQKYAGQFPGLKDPITKHLAELQGEFDAALALTDEDAQTRAMSVVNQRLQRISQPFKQLLAAFDEIERLKHDPAINELPAGAVNPAIRLAEQGILRARKTLEETGADTPGAIVDKAEQALRIANQGAADLRALHAQLQRESDRARAEADRARAEAEKAAAEAAAKEKPPEQPTVQPSEQPTGQ